jgi:hypothetical protein
MERWSHRGQKLRQEISKQPIMEEFEHRFLRATCNSAAQHGDSTVPGGNVSFPRHPSSLAAAADVGTVQITRYSMEGEG